MRVGFPVPAKREGKSATLSVHPMAVGGQGFGLGLGLVLALLGALVVVALP